MKKFITKEVQIGQCKAYKDAETGKVYLKGYANTKGHADSYGDIPTVFAALRSFVYDLNRFSKNPVMLIDHANKIDHVAGSFKELEEDTIGLRFKAEFSGSDLPLIKHAREVYLEGHAKALSISGWFYYEDKDNPTHLTLAELFEISLVGVGADENALGSAVERAVAQMSVANDSMSKLNGSEKMLVYKSLGIVKTDDSVTEQDKQDEKTESALKSLAESIKANVEIAKSLCDKLGR